MDRFKKLIANERLRQLVVIVVLLLTILIFIHFFAQHPEYLTTLRHIKLWVVLAILVLNVGVLLTLVIISNLILMLCGTRLSFKEQFLLTAYSSIANFFGPLQSGPGVRAAYLKAKHQVRMRDYTVATLMYYAMFALISASLLFGGSRPWWQTVVGLGIVALLCYSLIRMVMRRDKRPDHTSLHFRLPILGWLLLATFIQVCFVTAYYFVEVRAVNAAASLHQVIVYSGAANFALFVSLTPDAIGIRESFLVLSKRLHHLSSAVIFAANIIDRAVYALFLGLLFVFVLLIHAKDKLGLSKVV